MKITRYGYGPVHGDYVRSETYEVDFVKPFNCQDPFRFYLYTDRARIVFAKSDKQYPSRWEVDGKFYTMKTHKDVLDFYNLIQTELTLEKLA